MKEKPPSSSLRALASEELEFCRLSAVKLSWDLATTIESLEESGVSDLGISEVVVETDSTLRMRKIGYKITLLLEIS